MIDERKFLKVVTFLSIAEQLSNLSTCKRLKVGAVITDENFQVLSMGYNGRAKDAKHCSQAPETMPGECDCIHRQQNRIIFGGHYQHVKNKKIFTTVSPCLSCRRMLNQFGVKEVYYLKEYRDKSPLEYLTKNNIRVTLIS